MQKSKKAFTIIELVFVIVILGILAAIAVPKMAATRTDAQISKGSADVSSIRSAIVTERQGRLIKGQSGWITTLSNGGLLFNGVDANQTLLMYGLTPSTASGHWSGTDPNYTFTIGATSCKFTYDNVNGTFLPDETNDAICLQLTN